MVQTPKRVAAKRQEVRSSTGSMLLLGFLCLALLLPLCLLSGVVLTELNLCRGRHITAVEAASLTAASDLTRIVVNDPYFGYIALTDFAPTQVSTRAEDGEPLPVLGINTLWATCRNELIIADLIDNEVLRDMANADIEQARRATKLLTDTLSAALRPGSVGKFHDLDGAVVCPYEHTTRILLANSNQFPVEGTPKVGSLKLSLGWLDDACDSGTQLPQPLDMAKLSKDQKFGENYRAFVNVPASGQNFYFAALGQQPALVNGKRFRLPDGKRVCSIVRAEVDLLLPQQKAMQLIAGKSEVSIRAAACAEPRANADISVPGILRLSFEDGLVPRLSSIQDLLNNHILSSSRTDVLTAQDGDYPTDHGSRLSLTDGTDGSRSMTSIVALGLFDWLRSTHNKARLDSVLSMIASPFSEEKLFHSGETQRLVLNYELDGHGNVLRTDQAQNPFLDEVVSQNQKCASKVDAYVLNGTHWTMYFRDQVRNLGTATGGKHAGEAMPPNPLNWCELPFYGGNETRAGERLKGGTARGVTLNGNSEGCPEGSGGISVQSAEFRNRDGTALPTQPRKTFYSGGLAVEFRFLQCAFAQGDG